MLKEKALAYKNFVLEAKKAFNLIMNERENLDLEELGRLKRKFHPDEFENVFAEFEAELKKNCENYSNNQIIKSMLGFTFSDLCIFKENNTKVINTIIINDFETEFLLKFNENYNNQLANLIFLCEMGVEDPFNSLDGYLSRLRQPIKEKQEVNTTLPNPLFKFENLKKEIDKPEISVKEKLKTVQERLYDFLQWQKEFDTINTWLVGQNDCKYQITGELYPKFEDLCKIEIERLEKLIETEKYHNPVIKQKISKYKIASKHKTDVVKILSAMYDCNMFVNANGQPATNKQELMEAFGEFLGEDLKTYSTLLTQAKNKEENIFFSPFKRIMEASKRYYNSE